MRLAIAALVLASLALAQDVPVREGPKVIEAADAVAPESLAALCKEKGAIVAVTSATCPLSRKFAPKLARLEKETGLPVRLIDPVARADDRPLARALGATTTTEVFLLDARRRVVYRGALDDQYGIGYALGAPRREFLKEAVAALHAGKLPAVRATTAPGCRLDLEPPEKIDAPTYHERIAGILQRNCQACHRKGENAPFGLETYAEAKAQRDMIAYVVRKRLMPPWFAGAKSHAMANDRSLPDADRKDLIAWTRAGCPEGDPAKAPPPRAWPRGWRIGTPDVVYETPRSYVIPAEGAVEYVHTRVPTNLEEDRWVRAMEIRSSSPQHVHHVLVFLRYPRGHPNYTRRPQDRQGLGGYFAGMVPGQSALTYPDGYAKKLPAGALLQFQIHYTTNGKPARDVTKIGLIFAKEKPKHEVNTTGVFNVRFQIPPGARRHPVTSRIRVPFPIRVLGFMPHMHVRGTAFRYELIKPDKTREVLLDVPRYDFNWQLYYRLQKGLDIEAGSEVVATAWYDNSVDNPANPDPKQAVRYGEQTWEEMMIGYVDWHRR